MVRNVPMPRRNRSIDPSMRTVIYVARREGDVWTNDNRRTDRAHPGIATSQLAEPATG